MKIKLSKSQWKMIGKKAGWDNTQLDELDDNTPTQYEKEQEEKSRKLDDKRLDKQDRDKERVMLQKSEMEELYKKDPVAACRKAIAKTRNIPWKDRMNAINKILGGYGVEAINGNWENGYWADIVATYVNMGDTYATTVMMTRANNIENAKIIITNIGDWVEKYGKKFGVK